jgi:hypothetical protein
MPRTLRAVFIGVWCELQSRGIILLKYVRSALTLAATTYRRRYASTFATDHETRLVLFAQKIRAVNLAPSHHRAHRECTFIEAWLYSLRVDVRSTNKIDQQRKTTVADKSPLNFGGPLPPKPCLIPVALSNETGASGSYQSRR